MKKTGGSGGSKPMRSGPVKSGSSSGGMKPSRPSSPKPYHDPGPKIRPSGSPSPSKTSFLRSLNAVRMGKVNKPYHDPGPKIRPDGTVEEYVQEETVQQTSGGSRGCSCLPGCALGVLTTLAMLATALVKLL